MIGEVFLFYCIISCNVWKKIANVHFFNYNLPITNRKYNYYNMNKHKPCMHNPPHTHQNNNINKIWAVQAKSKDHDWNHQQKTSNLKHGKNGILYLHQQLRSIRILLSFVIHWWRRWILKNERKKALSESGRLSFQQWQ